MRKVLIALAACAALGAHADTAPAPMGGWLDDELGAVEMPEGGHGEPEAEDLPEDDSDLPPPGPTNG